MKKLIFALSFFFSSSCVASGALAERFSIGCDVLFMTEMPKGSIPLVVYNGVFGDPLVTTLSSNDIEYDRFKRHAVRIEATATPNLLTSLHLRVTLPIHFDAMRVINDAGNTSLSPFIVFGEQYTPPFLLQNLVIDPLVSNVVNSDSVTLKKRHTMTAVDASLHMYASPMRVDAFSFSTGPIVKHYKIEDTLDMLFDKSTAIEEVKSFATSRIYGSGWFFDVRGNGFKPIEIGMSAFASILGSLVTTKTQIGNYEIANRQSILGFDVGISVFMNANFGDVFFIRSGYENTLVHGVGKAPVTINASTEKEDIPNDSNVNYQSLYIGGGIRF